MTDSRNKDSGPYGRLPIKHWAVSTNQEPLDSCNGILLSALFDDLFDRGLITFYAVAK